MKTAALYMLQWSFFVSCLACASAPPAPPPAAVITYEQKMAWMLRLEDQRILRDPAPPPPPPAPLPRRGARAAPTPPPPPIADLTRLLTDDEARIRRRAALAIGRVGLRDGGAALATALADPEEEVRQMAAFALGLIGDTSAAEPLRRALADPSPIVQGRAAEALGMIGDASAGASIGAMAAAHVGTGALASIPPDDLTHPLSPPAEAFRLGAYALARLKAYEPLAAAVLDPQGQPRVRWWPVAYALQRVEDKRALPALRALANDAGLYTASFAIRGLGTLRDAAAFEIVRAAFRSRRKEPPVAVAAIRALGQLGDARAIPDLVAFVRSAGIDPNLRVEAVAALGALKAREAAELFMDLMGEPWPALRAAALRALAMSDPETFVTILSGMDADEHWSVRAALATTLGDLPPAMALPRLTAMLKDDDQRVLPSVLGSLVKLRAPDAAPTLVAQLKNHDVVVRAAAARLLGDVTPPNGAAALEEAYRFGASDSTYLARAAALAALAKYGRAVAGPLLKTALADQDWAVRVRAGQLLGELDPAETPAGEMRPAPTRAPLESYQAPALVAPAYSTHAYIETDKGTIELELAMLDAPLTVESFVTLARKGFFNGLRVHRVVPNFVIQGGDPRGDSEGGPGYTLRDELNELPYLRGTVGMALDWADTGGSQFFITHSPQPHLDARYTVFGRVVNGMEVVDRLQQWDAIQRVRIWDGATTTER